MAEPIDTGNKTISGRTIWNDPETGKDYSERSTTFQIEGKYYTMPTVSEDGSQYTEDQIRDYVKEHGPIDYLTGEKLPEFRYREDALQYAKSRSNTRKPKLAEGGDLNQQTEQTLTPVAYTPTVEKPDVDGWFDTAIEASAEPLSEAAKIFKNSGSGAVFNMLPEDSPRFIRALNRTNDYFAGLGYGTYKAGEAAAKFVVGAIADGLGQDEGEVLRGTLGSERQAYNDLMSFPDAFGGMVGGKSIQLLDDAVDGVGAFVSSLRANNTLEKVAGALPKYDTNTMGSMGGNLFAGDTPTPKPAGFNPKPKSQVNPLIKVNTNESTLDFYSSIPSALENLPVSKDGIAGSNVIAFLNKRAPNVNKTELYWSGLLETINPSKKYTKAELLNLSKKQTPSIEIQILTGEDVSYSTTQRVPLYYEYTVLGTAGKIPFEGKADEYVEFLIRNTNARRNVYKISKEEWKDGNVIAHARGSYKKSLDEGQEDFFLLEEIQSGPVQNNTVATPAAFKANKSGDVNFNQYYSESLNSILVEYSGGSSGLGVNFNPKFIKYAKDKYNLDAPDINNIADVEFFVERSIRDLVEDFSALKKNSLDGKQSYEEISKFLQKKYGLKKSILEESDIDKLEPLDNMFSNIVTNFIYKKSDVKNESIVNLVEDDMVSIFNEPIFEEEYNPLVPMKLSESVKVSLLAVIKDAKKRGVNKIYVPPIKDLEIAHSLGKEPAKNTYIDGLAKALNSLKSETNGQITFQRKNPAGSMYESDGTGTEIDITDFNIPKDAQIRFNKGGSVNNMARQTEMMFEEGGIADDGMTQDPVSGNEIPPGSLAEEVRDDIPAQLSEGEYVIPADVVRYYGVKFFENLRTKAKMGLQDMEEGGRIGGEPAPMPDESGISDQELQQIIQEEMNAATQQAPMMYMGGEVKKPTMYMAPGGLATTPVPEVPTAYTPPVISPGMQSVQFINKTTGQTMYIMFIDGKIHPPGTVIPAGFTKVNPMGEQAPAPAPAPAPEKTGGGGGGGGTPPKPPSYENWGKDTETFNPDYKSWAEGLMTGSDSSQSNLQMAGLGAAAFINPAVGVGMGMVGKAQPLKAAAEIKARAIIAEARGLTEEANALNGMVDKYMQNKGKLVNFANDWLFTGKSQAMGMATRLGFENLPNKDSTPEERAKFNEAFLREHPKASTPPKPTVVNPPNDDGDNNNGPSLATRNARARRVAQATADAKEITKDIKSDGITNETTAADDTTAGGASLDTAYGITGLNKGGLMTSKKKRQR